MPLFTNSGLTTCSKITNPEEMNQSKKYLRLREIGTQPSSSAIFISESIHLDSTKILKRALRELVSIATEKALRKPAIGALILSLCVTQRLIKHKTTLYAELNTAVKPPNFAQSQKICELNLNKMELDKCGLT